MKPFSAIIEWLDIRPRELGPLLLATAGAFLVISFLIVARSLREAFFLDEFSIEALPYVTMATAVVNIPSVILFTRLLARRPLQVVYRNLVFMLAAGLALLYVLTTWLPMPLVVWITTVGFFIWTAVGSLLLTSGFWVLTSETFALRSAKRLFGVISAGGTLGAMVAGLAVGPTANLIGNGGLVLSLIAGLLLAYFVQWCQPEPDTSRDTDEKPIALGENLGLVWQKPHLRLIAGIVATATLASFLLDYQFKEFAVAQYPNDEALAGFFGTFYGLTGVVALFLQVFLASRLLVTAGVAWSLSVLPLFLISGGTLLWLVPGFLTATLARGADNALRRSVHRAVIEYLFVPVPSLLRRRTKTLIDSLVDNAAEGASALFVSVWLAMGLPSGGLAFPLIVLAILLLMLAWRMGSRYMDTLRERLEEGREEIDHEMPADLVTGDLTVTMTRLELGSVIERSGLRDVGAEGLLPDGGADVEDEDLPDDPEAGTSPTDRIGRLHASDSEVIAEALEENEGWAPEHIPALIRLLARDSLYRRATALLAGLGEVSEEALTDNLLDEDADFVIRRRIPRVLALIETRSADEALVEGLFAQRFEVRYRSGVALARRRRRELPRAEEDEERIWEAVRQEVSHERPIWELQRLLDDRPAKDAFVSDRVYGRGELSLEHTFRLLSLVLDPQPTRTAFFGVILEDDRLQNISLEYLEQVLPADIRDELWPFIGDISDQQRERDLRDMDEVVDDLLKTGATLFAGAEEQARLREALEEDSVEDS